GGSAELVGWNRQNRASRARLPPDGLLLVVQADVADVDAAVVGGPVHDPVAPGRLGGVPAAELLGEGVGLETLVASGQALDHTLDLLLDGLVERLEVLVRGGVELYRPRSFQTCSAFTGLSPLLARRRTSFSTSGWSLAVPITARLATTRRAARVSCCAMSASEVLADTCTHYMPRIAGEQPFGLGRGEPGGPARQTAADRTRPGVSGIGALLGVPGFGPGVLLSPVPHGRRQSPPLVLGLHRDVVNGVRGPAHPFHPPGPAAGRKSGVKGRGARQCGVLVQRARLVAR